MLPEDVTKLFNANNNSNSIVMVILIGDIHAKTLFSVPHIEEPIQSTRRKRQMSKPPVVAKYINKLDSLYT